MNDYKCAVCGCEMNHELQHGPVCSKECQEKYVYKPISPLTNFTCTHELHEQVSACATDGLCPICLKAKVEELTKIIKNECLDWAEDHTHLEKICLEVGIAKDKVDSPDGGYSICDIQNLANLLKEEIERLKKAKDIYDTEHYTNE